MSGSGQLGGCVGRGLGCLGGLALLAFELEGLAVFASGGIDIRFDSLLTWPLLEHFELLAGGLCLCVWLMSVTSEPVGCAMRSSGEDDAGLEAWLCSALCSEGDFLCLIAQRQIDVRRGPPVFA
jgi:hypothetical protein